MSADVTPTNLTPTIRYANETPERRAFFETRRKYEQQMRAEAIRLNKLQAFVEKHRDEVASFYADKIGMLNAFFSLVKDDEGMIDPLKVAEIDPKVAKLMFDEIARLEKTAGFAGVTKTETTVTHSLTDQWKALSAGNSDVIEAEVVSEGE